ncbi:hypothetical protein M885DRAFT_622839 [Pelagophyceae sp. CCMP2097]|nr:hypothetical protein M885DRAFT_622839 [Pelagophyceae sp. CCMP2097]|mmetsp:Transcript_19845/g.68382  ORF Transcript_19845/g.68382 Transcript_19845/m.68382 type:complete len:1986 (+) Transcript_19845:106-6063(+)
MDFEDRLEIRIIEAKRLQELQGGECNPYAVVECGREREQTPSATGTTEPVWNAPRAIFLEVASNDVQHIVVKVFHKSSGADIPLGQAAIELRSCVLSPGIETDEWYSLEAQRGQVGHVPGGRVRIEMSYFVGDESALADDDDDDDDGAAAPRPNMLVGTIGRTRQLMLPGKEAPDAYITVTLDGRKHSTLVKRGTSHSWDEPFRLPVDDGTLEVRIKVKDRGVVRSRLIGTVGVPMVEVAASGAAGLTKWCRLLGEGDAADGVSRGEVELTLAWVYDRRYAASLSRMLTAASELLMGKGGAARKKQAARLPPPAAEPDELTQFALDRNEVVQGQAVRLSVKEQAEMDERRIASKMMAERRLDDLVGRADHRMAPGDYQVQVHVVEVRDLKGEDLSGLSDPYARVKVLGRARKTRVVRQVSSCVFDETLYFNLKDVTSAAVEEAVVEVQILDYDAFSGHAMIGKATFDVRDVHARPGHEYYRQWVGLIDTTNDDDRGYQGYAKLSITVLGRGDAQKTHDVEREYLDELDAALEGGGDAGGMALVGPAAVAKQCFLVVYVWEAEDLPSMNAGAFSSGGIEAYVRCDFAGSRARTSSVAIAGGKGSLAPTFHEELWIPVSEPCEAKRIGIGLWDYNTFSKDKPVAHAYFDYGDIPRNEAGKSSKASQSWLSSVVLGGDYDGPRPRWHNLYGAPLGVQGKRGAVMNRYGDEASTYRGRVLLSMQVLTKPASKESRVAHRKDFSFRPAQGLKPQTAKYHLRALCLMGTEIPVLRARAASATAKMRVVMTIGAHEMFFDWVKNERGVCTWNQLEALKFIDLPVLLDDVPDVCLYLERGAPGAVLRVCYARIPAARLLRDSFAAEPKWEPLVADKARTRRSGGVALRANPGALLLKLGLGLSADALDPALMWRDAELLKKFDDQAPFQLRVYVYQARRLPASDDNGLIDAYVKVRFCGSKKRTATRSMTTAPQWYETLVFDEMLPRDALFGPDVVVQVWDEDNFSPNSPAALLRIPLAECAALQNETSRAPRPTWRRLSDVNGEPVQGELLVACALIRKRELNEKYDRCESIAPKLKQAWVEVTSVGVRQLKAHHFRAPREPYVSITVASADPEDGATTFRTKSSRNPSGRDANFIERKVLDVLLPEDALFAPMLDLRVFDASRSLVNGLQRPLLGACAIDLATKMPWNARDFVPPQMQLFDDSAARMRQQVIDEANRQREAAEDAEDASEDGAPAAAGNLGLEFGGEDEDDDASGDDDEGYVDVEQFELERYGASPRGYAGADTGVGAFDPSVSNQLPQIYEDVLFEEEMRLRAVALEADAAAELKRAGGRSYMDMLSARLASATDEDAMAGERKYKLSDLPIDFPTQWADAAHLRGRDWWVNDSGGNELEDFLKTRPLEVYTVYRGKHHPNAAKSTLRPVGVFKGLIRVLESDPKFEQAHFLPLQILEPQAYTVRLYVTKGSNLQPVDGRSCDPYLRVKLGGTVDDRPQDHADKTLKPEFCQAYEFQTMLPGPSTLKIQVKDWNQFYPVHELVGETRIDLEDRWFHRDWQALDAVAAPSKNPLKPVEVRNLTKDTSSVNQGQVHMWLEIRKPADARREAAVELLPAQKKHFEIRVICWASREVPFSMGDYYAQFWVGDSKKQKTDVHWRCRNGRASWNWRLKFPIELPLASPELGRLNMQLWDQDIIKWNDVIGDAQLDLYKWLLKAYSENKSVDVFKVINDAITVKEARDQGLAAAEDLVDSESDEEEEADLEQGDAGDEDGGGDDVVLALKGDDVENPLLEAGDGRAEGAEESKGGEDGKDVKDGEDGKKKKKKKGASDSDDEAELTAEEKKLKDNETAEKDAGYFLQQLKQYAGLGDLDDSAQYLKMTYTQRKRGKVRVLNRGSIAISVEILPADEAELKPAGLGISNPNSNPVLPPRTGRLSFSYNPFAVCTALVGPKLAVQLCCCLLCILCLIVWYYLGMYYTNIYTFFKAFGLTAAPGAAADDD